MTENTPIIGIDVGFGYTKAVGDEDKVFIQPSLAAEYTPTAFSFNSFDTITANGKEFVTGDTVIECGYKSTPTIRNDYFISDEAIALIISSIYNVAPKNNVDSLKANIVLGLPPGFFSEQIIEQLKNKLVGNQFVYKNQHKQITISVGSIAFVPQGLGAYIAHIHDNQRDPDQNCVVIDIGFHTVDLVLIVKGKYAFNKAVSHPIGVKTLFDSIKDGVSKKFGILIPDEAVQRILKKGSFTHFGVNYSYDYSNELKNYKSLLLNYLKNYAQEVNTVVEEVILAGGGAVFLSSSFSGASLVNYPQIANARGYYLYGRKIWRNKNNL